MAAVDVGAPLLGGDLAVCACDEERPLLKGRTAYGNHGAGANSAIQADSTPAPSSRRTESDAEYGAAPGWEPRIAAGEGCRLLFL